MLLSQVPAYFKQRRSALCAAHPGAVFIIPGERSTLRNHDIHYPFRQESGFYYLTGFEEPSAILVLAIGRTFLFVQPRNTEQEVRDGERYGLERAVSVFGADEAFAITDFDRTLPRLLRGAERVFYRLGKNSARDRKLLDALETQRSMFARYGTGRSMLPVYDPTEALGEMRLIKSSDEMALIRQACGATMAAHLAAMRGVRPGMRESEVETLVNSTLFRGGCRRLSYNTIVAGGANATYLHYEQNNAILKEGDLLLLDAGGEFGYYAADVTRTLPVGKKFSEAQAALYEVVLAANEKAIAMVRPGISLEEIHIETSRTLLQGLLSGGILPGTLEEANKSGMMNRIFPHPTSHWLGMDVHDPSWYAKAGKHRVLVPGIVVTIEPGVYFSASDSTIAPEFRGIGIRIEDDLLVTETGCENLTAGLPKGRAEIEAIRAEA